MRKVLLGIAALAVGFAPAPFPKRERPGKDDWARLQGTWVVVKCEHNGRDATQPMRYVFQGRRMYFSVGNRVRSSWDVELSSGSSPRVMVSREVNRTLVFRGIYRFDGDKLILCESMGDRPVPTAFDSKDGRLLTEMKRR